MTTYIWMLLFIHSPAYNIDPNLAAAVIKTESNFNPKAVGKLKEIGLFQIRPQFSKYTKAQLFDPETNVIAGLAMLKEAKDKCVHKINRMFVICHNAGLVGATRIEKPAEFPYYRRVHAHYVAYKR